MKDDRIDKVTTYVLGMLDNARDAKIITGGRIQLTEAGKKEYERLKKEGFKPTEQEIEIAFTLISDPPPEVIKIMTHKSWWKKLISLFKKKK